jgi:hypothetical protein
MKEYRVIEMGGFRPEVESELNSFAVLGWELKGAYRQFAILERDATAVDKTASSPPPPEVKTVSAPAPVAAAAPKPQVVVSKPVFPARRK